MPLIRSSVSKRRACVVAVIFSLSKIMPTCSCCVLKGLVYVAIIAPLGHQPFSYTKCIKLNMRLSCNIRLVSNAKCAYFIYFYIL